MCVQGSSTDAACMLLTNLAFGSSSLPDVSADGLHDALTHLDGSLGGLIPSPHLLGMVRNLGNLDNLFQEDGGLLQHKLEVLFKAVGDLPSAEVGQQQHVDLFDSCLAVPEQGLVLQHTGLSMMYTHQGSAVQPNQMQTCPA